MLQRFAWSVTSLALLVAAPCFAQGKVHRMVIVPEEDRFTPFALTIRAGESVQWVNEDTDDHTVVSDDPFNTAGHQGFNQMLPGTDSNGGQPGTLTLHFTHPGTFVYFCRFHAHLDEASQPVAPGPEGGIQDENGNFGTPMMGVITVLAGGPPGGHDGLSGPR
jgi:plastocyanin